MSFALLPRRRPGPLVRLRSHWRAAQLDEALADGADPLSSKCLLCRADQLTNPARRRAFADRIEHLIEVSNRETPPRLTDPPILRRDPIRVNRALLRVLVARLRDDAPIALAGLASVELLVGFDRSPLYQGRSPLELRWRLLDVLARLDPFSPAGSGPRSGSRR